MNVYILDAQIRVGTLNRTKRLVVQTTATQDTEEHRYTAIVRARQYIADMGATLISLGVSDYGPVIEAV